MSQPFRPSVYEQEVAVADKGLISGLSGSWSLVEGNRWAVLGLFLTLFVISTGVSVVLIIVEIASSIAELVISMPVYAVVGVFHLAVQTRAYEQLREVRAERLDPKIDPDW